jgi:hypothetical protein
MRSPTAQSSPVGSRSALDQGIILDDDANAFFTAAESFGQPQASELSSQRIDFDRSAGCCAAREDVFLGSNTSGGPTG